MNEEGVKILLEIMTNHLKYDSVDTMTGRDGKGPLFKFTGICNDSLYYRIHKFLKTHDSESQYCSYNT